MVRVVSSTEYQAMGHDSPLRVPRRTLSGKRPTGSAILNTSANDRTAALSPKSSSASSSKMVSPKYNKELMSPSSAGKKMSPKVMDVFLNKKGYRNLNDETEDEQSLQFSFDDDDNVKDGEQLLFSPTGVMDIGNYLHVQERQMEILSQHARRSAEPPVFSLITTTTDDSVKENDMDNKNSALSAKKSKKKNILADKVPALTRKPSFKVAKKGAHTKKKMTDDVADKEAAATGKSKSKSKAGKVITSTEVSGDSGVLKRERNLSTQKRIRKKGKDASVSLSKSGSGSMHGPKQRIEGKGQTSFNSKNASKKEKAGMSLEKYLSKNSEETFLKSAGNSGRQDTLLKKKQPIIHSFSGKLARNIFLQHDTKNKFKRLLDQACLKYFSDESFKVELKKIGIMIKNDPYLCTHKYCFEQEAALPLHLYPLHVLCVLGAPLITIKKCYKAFPKAIDDSSPSSSEPIGSPLHYACLFHTHQQEEEEEKSYLDVVQFLVTKQPALLLCTLNHDRRTPLHMACMICPNGKKIQLNGRYRETLHGLETHDLCDISVDTTDDASTCSTMSCGDSATSGSNGWLKTSHDFGSDDCSHARVMNANGNEVLAFLTKIFPKATKKTDRYGFTPIHLACSNENPSLELIQHLVCINPEACVIAAKDGSTPMHKIVERMADAEKREIVLAIIKCLIKFGGKEVLCMADRKGNLPLHVAVLEADASISSKKILKLLIKYHPEALNTRDSCGFLPRTLAKSKQLDAETLRMLCAFV